MNHPAESMNIEAAIKIAERQRRWLRRGCWIGCGLMLVAVVVVMGLPLFARWQLMRHGWELETFSRRGLPDWAPLWADPWFGRIDSAQLRHRPLRNSDVDLLRHIPNVGLIFLESTDVSDSALEKISQLPNLWAVDFNAVNLESAALRHLQQSPKLEALNFVSTRLNDAAMEHIANCPHLTGLRLIDVGITDDGLLELKHCATLKAVLVKTAAVTSAGADELRNNRSGLDVSID
jgi:hypothetical protein